VGDFVQIDLNPEGRMTFTKQLTSTMSVPEWERFGVPAAPQSREARAGEYLMDANLR
jgi:hypothetical protein